MEQELSEIIEKNLPAMVGEELKKRLTLCDELEKTKKDLEGDVSKLTERRDHYRGRSSELEDELSEHKSLHLREEAVAVRERNASLFELQQQLEAEKRVSKHATEMGLGLVRNTSYRKAMETISHGYSDHNGCYHDTGATVTGEATTAE